MNERIKELALQAASDYNDANGVFIPDDFVEKFAELIVEECIFAIDEQCKNTDAEATIEAIDILVKHFRS